ncbi:MAG: sugar ABC transporter permease [Rubrivivax sp.]|nr:sugar ABC transporter permease [Rubrivivax sp.]
MDWLKRLGSRLATPLPLGLAVALSVVLAASGWLHASVAGDLAAGQRERAAMLLANAVAASLAGADEAATARRLALWQREHGSLREVRVIAGRELRASTVAADDAPRALKREEKALFDLAQELRAADETNTAEGAPRKKTMRVEHPRNAAGDLVVSVPLRAADGIEGMVQARLRLAGAELAAAGQADSAAPSPWPLAVALLAAALVLGALLPPASARRFDVGRGIAVALLLAGAAWFQQQQLARMAADTAAGDGAVAALQAAAAATYLGSGAPAGAAAPALPAAPAAPAPEAAGASVRDSASAWDTDAYGRPLRLVSPEGRRLDKANRAAASHRSFLTQAFAAIDVVGLAVLLFFVQGLAARSARAVRANRLAYAYVAPAMLGMLVLVFFPFFYGITLAFTDTTLFNENLPFRDRWVGLANFVNILGDFEIVRTSAEGTVVNYQNFYWTLAVTVIWTVTNVTVGVSFGFLLALALNTEGLRGKTVYRVLLILPWAIPNYITALVWRGMFHPQFGVINQALQMFGFAPVRWFDGVVSSFMTGLVTNGWLSFPFMMVVILGALQSIPRDMYEAADVEGASRWQQFRRITLPLLRPTLVPAVVISVVWTFNMFNIIFLVSGGEPGGANEILVTKAYKIAFEQYQYAYAAAYSTVIFVILLVYGYFQTRLTRATESY